MAVYTYLIKSLIDQSFYVGISHNPVKRLSEHNQGKLKITASKRPYLLVYNKKYLNYLEARRHEKWLKKKSRVYKEKLTKHAPPIQME